MKAQSKTQVELEGSSRAAGRYVSRRGFLLAAGGTVVAASGLAADAFAWEPYHVGVTRHTVPVRGLPSALEGLRIAHLTDIHFYDGMHPAAERAMAAVAGLRPDLTVVTGDLVERANQLGTVRTFLEGCRGRLGTYVTLGNWEYHARVQSHEMARAAARAGAELLVNQSVVVKEGGAELAVVGLDDPRAGHPDPARALEGLPSGIPTLWAFHAPGLADEVRDRGYPAPCLALAGHTHGGQIRLPLLPAVTPPASGRFVAGWYHDTFAPLYVSRGIGTSGIRARLGAEPEVAVFELTAQAVRPGEPA
jgi:predicted MPP superfamily phosphohydrolase